MNKKHNQGSILAYSLAGLVTATGISYALANTTFAEGGGVEVPPAEEEDAIDVINVTVLSSCTITNTVDTAHETSLIPGNYESNIGTTTFKTICNDADGYAIYAIGYGSDTNGNTDLVANSPLTTSDNIVTGTATTGNVSNWAVKVAAGTDAIADESMTIKKFQKPILKY